MSQETLVANLRQHTGKKANRALRRLEKIPAILYGQNKSIMLEMDENATRLFIGKMQGAHQMVPLKVTDESGNTEEYKVLLQEIQKHPYKPLLIHLDFRLLDPEKNITIKVPLRTVGTAPGVKKGGTLQLVVREVPVTCTPDKIPEFVELDVSELDFQGGLRVSDINYPESVKSAAAQNYTVAGIIGRKA